jgi:hypothetical protein
MEMPIKFYNVKRLIENIDYLRKTEKGINQALSSETYKVIISYGFINGGEIKLDDNIITSRILKEELIRIQEEIKKLLDELENLK